MYTRVQPQIDNRYIGVFFMYQIRGSVHFPSLTKNPLSGSIILIRVFWIGVSLSFLDFNSFFHVPHALRLPQLLVHLYKTLPFLFLFMNKIICIGMRLHECSGIHYPIIQCSIACFTIPLKILNFWLITPKKCSI